MSTKLTIRDVSDTTHDVLAARAKRQRQSLSRYVADLLDREAATPTMDEIIDRVTSRPRVSGSSDVGIDVLREIRDAS